MNDTMHCVHGVHLADDCPSCANMLRYGEGMSNASKQVLKHSLEAQLETVIKERDEARIAQKEAIDRYVELHHRLTELVDRLHKLKASM
jgi:hypothetical protein